MGSDFVIGKSPQEVGIHQVGVTLNNQAKVLDRNRCAPFFSIDKASIQNGFIGVRVVLQGRIEISLGAACIAQAIINASA